MKELTIFAKSRTNADGKKFTTYLSTLTKKDGSTHTVAVKFRAEIEPPKEFPCNIIVEKSDINLQERIYTRQDTGELAKAYTLWVSGWKRGSKYVDHSLDDYDV